MKKILFIITGIYFTCLPVLASSLDNTIQKAIEKEIANSLLQENTIIPHVQFLNKTYLLADSYVLDEETKYTVTPSTYHVHVNKYYYKNLMEEMEQGTHSTFSVYSNVELWDLRDPTEVANLLTSLSSNPSYYRLLEKIGPLEADENNIVYAFTKKHTDFVETVRQLAIVRVCKEGDTVTMYVYTTGYTISLPDMAFHIDKFYHSYLKTMIKTKRNFNKTVKNVEELMTQMAHLKLPELYTKGYHKSVF